MQGYNSIVEVIIDRVGSGFGEKKVARFTLKYRIEDFAPKPANSKSFSDRT